MALAKDERRIFQNRWKVRRLEKTTSACTFIGSEELSSYSSLRWKCYVQFVIAVEPEPKVVVGKHCIMFAWWENMYNCSFSTIVHFQARTKRTNFTLKLFLQTATSSFCAIYLFYVILLFSPSQLILRSIICWISQPISLINYTDQLIKVI